MKYCIAGHPRGGVATGRDPPTGGTADKVRKILSKIAALKAQYFCKKKKKEFFSKNEAQSANFLVNIFNFDETLAFLGKMC